MSKCFSVESYINRKKLLFFGRLCRLDSLKLAKKVFIERVYQFKCHLNKCTGFVCDLYRIATKYDLLQYFDVFTSETNFPDKKSWRVVVDAAILGVEKRFLLESVSQDPTLTRFYEIQGNCHSFHPVWVAEARTSGHKKHYRDLAKLNCVKQGKYLNKLCSYCSKMYFDQLDHYFHHCSKYSPYREAFGPLLLTCVVFNSAVIYIICRTNQ
jgi:hypothetical protein